MGEAVEWIQGGAENLGHPSLQSLFHRSTYFASFSGTEETGEDVHDSSWQAYELPLASSVLMLLLEGAQNLTIQSGPEADVAVE